MGSPLLITAWLALSLYAAGILMVEAQLPGYTSRQSFRVLYPSNLKYECNGTTVTATLASLQLPTRPYAVEAPDGSATIQVERAAYGTSTPRQVFEFFLHEQGSLTPDITVDVFQVKNSANGLCWTSGPLGSTLQQVACASSTSSSSIDSPATRRQLFLLTLQRNVACQGADDVYQILSAYDSVTNRLNEQSTPLALTPHINSDVRLSLPSAAASEFFITSRSLTE